LGTDGVLSAVLRDGLYVQKVLWVGAPTYTGPALIRGGRLGGGGSVQFALGDSIPEPELRLTAPTASSGAAASGWRQWPSYTMVPAMGCYAYQVDGQTFTSVLAFEVRG
jgi:hypothetical protein